MDATKWLILGLSALLALGAGCLSTDSDDADQGGGGKPGGTGDDDDTTTQMDLDATQEATQPGEAVGSDPGASG